MDIRLAGGTDGIQAAQKIRASTAVVFTSAYSDEATVARACTAAAFGFLVKPFSDLQLRAAVEVAAEHHRIEQWLREEDLRFLVEAGARLSSSLELSQTLKEITAIVVPRLAEGCIVDLLGPDGSLGLVAATHVGVDYEGRLRRARRLPPAEIDPTRGIGSALSTGQIGVEPAGADQATLSRLFGFADANVCAAGRGENIWAPLVAGGRTIGVLSLCCRPDSHDRELVAALAGRIATAIENARLYAQAQRAIQLREDALAIATHDLRNPLSAILAAAELLQEAVQGPPLRHVESVVRCAQGMKRMVDDLLVAARIEAGQLRLDIERAPVHVLVEPTLDMFRGAAEKKRIRIESALPCEPVAVLCDRGRIVEALANLVDNSLKFTPEGGAVTIRAEESAGEVRLSVRDTGCGMRPEMVTRAFERYRSGPGTPRAAAGLGLYIVKGIVDAHGGQIAIASTPGAGTTVSFTLPRAQ
jgi:signal transduction histidine kinase